jgi:hypothetical protein
LEKPAPHFSKPWKTCDKKGNPNVKIKMFLCGALLAVGVARAELPPATIRAIQTAHQDSVLMLSGALKFMCGRCNQVHDTTVEGPVTVVDTNGLLLTSSSTVKITLLTRKVEVRASTLKVKLPGGAELPVRVVLTDGDLDAVLLAPETPSAVPAGAFKPVNWDAAVKAQILDDIVIVGRMDKNHDALVETAPAKINSVETKPRLMYGCAMLASGDGEAVFNAAGQLLGVGLGRQTIVAAEELQDVIEQARHAAANVKEQP